MQKHFWQFTKLKLWWGSFELNIHKQPGRLLNSKMYLFICIIEDIANTNNLDLFLISYVPAPGERREETRDWSPVHRSLTC